MEFVDQIIFKRDRASHYFFRIRIIFAKHNYIIYFGNVSNQNIFSFISPAQNICF